LRDDFRCFRSKMCFRTFSAVPLNSPMVMIMMLRWRTLKEHTVWRYVTYYDCFISRPWHQDIKISWYEDNRPITDSIDSSLQLLPCKETNITPILNWLTINLPTLWRHLIPISCIVGRHHRCSTTNCSTVYFNFTSSTPAVRVGAIWVGIDDCRSWYDGVRLLEDSQQSIDLQNGTNVTHRFIEYALPMAIWIFNTINK